MIKIFGGKILVPTEYVTSKALKDKLGVHWYRQQKCWAVYATARSVATINGHFGTELEAPTTAKKAPKISFPFKTTPKDYQYEALEAGLGRSGFGYLLDPGLGKTKVIVDEAQILHSWGQLHSVAVVCPLNAMKVWADQIRIHGYSELWSIDVWGRPEISQGGEGLRLRWAVINKDALVSPTKKGCARKISDGFKWAYQFMAEGGYTMLVIDESTDIAGHDSWRTTMVMRLRALSNYRRALNGTFIADKPLDAYSQLNFLDPNIVYNWNFYEFRDHFCVMGGYEVGGTFVEVDGKVERVGGKPVQILGYRHLDELTAMIDSVSYKKRKSEVMSLPPKTYEVRYVNLTDKSKKIYNEAVSELEIQIEDSNISLELAITKAIKLRQITGGAVKDDGGTAIPVGHEKLDDVMATLKQVGKAKVLIWCQFRHEIDRLWWAIKEAGYKVGCYHGGVDRRDRDAMITNFEKGDLQVMILQNDAGYRAITLIAAEYAFIYSNPEKLDVRVQLEDRCHREGLKHNVTYVDFIVPGSMDEIIIDSTKFKGTVADYVMWGEGENKTYNVRSRVLRRLK